MRSILSILCMLSHLTMLLLPFYQKEASSVSASSSFPGWPKWVEDQGLLASALREEEQNWARRFPGIVGRFRSEQGEYLVRWIRQPTRALHPIADCLRGSGYVVSPAPLRRGESGSLWGCSEASRGEKKEIFCEQIRDESGNSWSDVSSWYWAALLGRTTGPWWAVARSI